MRRIVREGQNSKIFNPLATSTPKPTASKWWHKRSETYFDVVRKSSLLIAKPSQVIVEGTAEKPIELSPPPTPPPMTQRFAPKSPSYSPQRAMDVDTSLISTDVSRNLEDTERMDDRTVTGTTPATQAIAQSTQDQLNASHDQTWMALMDEWEPAQPPPAQWTTQPATQAATTDEPGPSTATQPTQINGMRLEPVDEEEDEIVVQREPDNNVDDIIAAALETTETLRMMTTQPTKKDSPARKVSISILALELDRRIEETPCHCEETTRLVCEECRREFFLERKCNAAALIRWNVHKHNPTRYAEGTCPICHTVPAKYKKRRLAPSTSSSNE